MIGWFKKPALHFVLLGGLLYAALPPDTGDANAPDRRLVISADRVRQLAAGFHHQWGQAPTRAELEATVALAVDDRLLELEARRLALEHFDRRVRERLIQKMRAVGNDPALGAEGLYRAALALGLDDDVVVRRHLRQKMRLLLQRDPAAKPLTEQDFATCLERHRDRFQQAAAASFSHIFLSRKLHGERLAERATAVLSRLDAERSTPEAATELSDPFPLAAKWRARTRPAIARQFGETFAEKVMALEPGAWSEPIGSPFGLHLVWVHERHPERLPPVDAVRQQLVHLLEEERAATRLAFGLEQLHDLYQVRIEWPAEMGADDAVAGS